MTGAEPYEVPLRLVVAAQPETQAQALSVVRVWCPAPHRVDALDRTLPSDVDAVLLWWGARAAYAVPVARATGVPLIALCGGGADDQATALEAGSDAACALPVHPRLLRALVAAYRRRSVESVSADSTLLLDTERDAEPSEDVLVAGPIRLDRRSHICEVAGRRLDLTLKEFDLIAYFLDNAGACCARDELLERVWGLDFDPGSNSVDVFVYTLRRKLKALGFVGVIQTVRGLGYRLVPPSFPA